MNKVEFSFCENEKEREDVVPPEVVVVAGEYPETVVVDCGRRRREER